ncbi:hypothetical protein QVD17_04844 [Tagetes erecta]|uniref:Uncharacterized protein n=1 Tax=Tagetes erecta TaxID=13708 RepID=A0AAD8LDX8_TARER|nr:hypothetical protein QVD17_04844 [Tagetes erecta]
MIACVMTSILDDNARYLFFVSNLPRLLLAWPPSGVLLLVLTEKMQANIVELQVLMCYTAIRKLWLPVWFDYVSKPSP